MVTTPVNPASTASGYSAAASPFFSTGSTSSPSSTSTAATTGSSSTSGSSGTATTTNNGLSLSPSDFVNLMITQLKNQDPTQPTSNADLLQEMSQIGQLESQDSLQTSLKTMVLQNQIGSASNFIGKSVTGVDTNNNTINGVVDSVHVENGGVNLVLDNGSTLALSNLTDVNSGSSGAAMTATAAMPVIAAGTTGTGTSSSTTTGG